MANTLIKDLDYTVLSEGTTGSPGTPPTPAYCTTSSKTTTAYPTVYVTQEDGTVLAFPGDSVTTTVTTTTCFPATAGTPAIAGVQPNIFTDFNLGWDGGAQSIDTLLADGTLKFSVRSGTVGAVVGMNSGPVLFSFGSIQHGLYFRGGFASVVERGISRTAVVPFLEADVFRIERVGTIVRYFQNTTLLHTSDDPSYGTQYLQAVLYSGGDAVTDPVMETTVTSGLGQGAAVLEPLAATGGIEASYGDARLQPLSSQATGISEQGGEAVLPALIATGSSGSYAQGTAVLQPLTATALAGAPQLVVAAARIGPLISSGLGTTASISLNPATSLGDSTVGWVNSLYAGATVFIISGTGAGQSRLIADNTGQALLFNTAWVTIPDATSFYEIRAADGTVLASGFVTPWGGALQPLFSLASNKPYGGASATLQPLTSFGAQGMRLTFYAFPVAPMGRVQGTITPGANALTASAPMATLAAFAGASTRLRAPMSDVAATATGTNWLAADIAGPSAQVQATATFAETVNASITAPMGQLIGYAGMVCEVSLAGRPTLDAQITTGGIARASITAPMAKLELFEATTESFLTASITAPMGEMGRSLQAWVMAPMGRLTAIGTAVVAATREAYAVNLQHRTESAIDEVTRYTNFPFTHVVRHQGSYYGANSTGLYLLEGTTDDGTPIPWALKTAMDDLGQPTKKTIDSAYFGGRFGPASTVQLHAGERAPNTYSYDTPKDALAQNHRQKFGRGVKERYYALGASGTDVLEIDTIELEVRNMTRRI